ncbi:hypothetical protein pb186bvf_008046 [Paramecium bursaria]
MFDAQKPLGSGSCGKVYLGFYAKGTGNEQTYLAIKEIPVKSSTDITDSLLQEINVLRKLNHPNIVGFIDAKKNEDYMFLVTQFCNQGTVEDWILQHNLSEEDVILQMRQIGQAFQYLTQKNIIHRDIKPSNLLLHNDVVKVADFGLAKVMDQSLKSTKFQTFSGTPVFMAPQLIRQEIYNSSSDIWSLGVTFYFMLFKEYPWEDSNPLKLLKKIEHKVENLIPEGATISEATRDLLKRMLVIDENRRMQWDEFFNHRLIKTEEPLHTISTLDIIEDLTRQNFVVTSSASLSDQEISDLQEYGRRQTINYLALQNRIAKARKAKDSLEFEKSIGVFFLQVAKELESQKKINPTIIAEDLYVKCMFLIYKRVYCVFQSLNQMLLFDSNESGIIYIDEEDWKELLNSDLIDRELQQLRVTTQRDYDYSKKEYNKWKDLLHEAQYSFQQFNITDRGDAYKSNIEENEYLIMAINDNFKPLFMQLAEQLEQVYIKSLETQKVVSKQYLLNDKKIDFIFVYDLIIFICFRHIIKREGQPQINFQKYYEERKRVEEIEILHRIHRQYSAWK